MPHVFISYVRENKEEVDLLYGVLTEHGIKVWIARNDIKPGERWQQAIRKAIQDGAFFIACFSKEYNERSKTYMNEELTLAIEELRQRPTDKAWFIPVKLNECDIPDRSIGAGETLGVLQYVELYKNREGGIQRILDVVKPNMQESQESYVGLKRFKEQMEGELMMAGEVQRSFLPQEYPNVPDLEFSHRYISKFGVGGDFLDIKELSHGVVEIFIADVMGHGPQAAMIAGVIKTLHGNLNPGMDSPGRILSEINEKFHGMMVSGGLPIFVTAFCMVINAANGKYTYSNAGHPTPFLVRNRSPHLGRIPSESGPALGMLPNFSYEEQEQGLEGGDMLFFSTDGLEELVNRDRVQFNEMELQKAVLNNMHLMPRSFVEAIICAADAFSDGVAISDDIMLLAVSYKK